MCRNAELYAVIRPDGEKALALAALFVLKSTYSQLTTEGSAERRGGAKDRSPCPKNKITAASGADAVDDGEAV